ncbi:homoserine kinase [Longirhabdus pacifica]|uniref:homoserine kinase n=1 Tax=Longirhabdus pacifica TaxID=2305227 RepID=UPI001008BF68|nr:homoserine kinase [Longirhabdus pacifica]
MLIRNEICVKVPASTANLGPGFDCLGMSLDLYIWIKMKVSSDQTIIKHYGVAAEGVPLDENNLIYKVAQQVFERCDVHAPYLHIDIYSEIPLSRGLGSSASAIVGGMVAANALLKQPLSKDTLFQMATALEGHPDNIAASLFGGVVITTYDGKQAECIRVEVQSNLMCLVVVPAYTLPTSEARKVLPASVSFQHAVYNNTHTALLVAAFCTGQYQVLSVAMQDTLHQPYRGTLIPGLEEWIQDAKHNGAIAAALSGAGPTMIAFTDQSVNDPQLLEQYAKRWMEKHNIDADMTWLTPVNEGAHIVECSEVSELIVGREDRQGGVFAS